MHMGPANVKGRCWHLNPGTSWAQHFGLESPGSWQLPSTHSTASSSLPGTATGITLVGSSVSMYLMSSQDTSPEMWPGATACFGNWFGQDRNPVNKRQFSRLQFEHAFETHVQDKQLVLLHFAAHSPQLFIPGKNSPTSPHVSSNFKSLEKQPSVWPNICL